ETMNIRTYIRKEQLNADGTASIWFEVSRARIRSGETCKPEAWDKDRQAIKIKFAGADAANRRLTQKRAALYAIAETSKPFDSDAVRRKFREYLEDPKQLDSILDASDTPEETITFVQLIDDILHEYRTTWAPGYMKKFRSLRTKIIEYDATFNVSKLTTKWLREFFSYCVEELDNVNNTINTDLKVVKRLTKILRTKGYRIPADIDEMEYKYIEPEINSITWDAVKAIEAVDLSEPVRETYPASRVAWLVGAYTGRRWSEVERMTDKNFYQDNKKRWRYRRTAKGLKPVVVPLLPDAVAFLKRIKFPVPSVAQQTVNRDIKEIAKIAG